MILKWLLVAQSLNRDKASHTEIMKQWITQNNLYEQNDHTIVLGLLTDFNFESVSSHMTLAYFLKLAIPIIHLFALSQVCFFLQEHFETDEKKFLRN